MQKDLVVAELQRVASLLDSQSVSRSQFIAHATISSAAVEQAFGSWNDAIKSAGLIPLAQGGTPKDERWRTQRVTSPATAGLGRGRIPDEELLADLLRVATELGRRPSGNQVAARGKYNPTVYQRRWGSIAAAYEAALKNRDIAAAILVGHRERVVLPFVSVSPLLRVIPFSPYPLFTLVAESATSLAAAARLLQNWRRWASCSVRQRASRSLRV